MASGWWESSILYPIWQNQEAQHDFIVSDHHGMAVISLGVMV
jgi:hypothetical protein